MNIKEIKDMINLMNENNLTELELEKDGFKIRLKKESKIAASDKEILIEQSGQVQETKKYLREETEISKLIEIKAPMVGTFYSTPSPESPPYVKKGDIIEIGQVICIIEAMKLMNEIKSELKGRIKDILVENGDPVEFGQTLFLIEPI
ncbi:MAG: acetyl-CoA carboxylase biotin carboxyl carrier protein [Candidatus Omnitrophica bacterium]|nr:acetyl-CoA carboxylase biotin carboxyl carrier protein [Candidatus Omnitrophota bacterium]